MNDSERPPYDLWPVLREATLSRRFPRPAWFGLAVLIAIYYSVFHADSPRLWAFAIAYWLIAACFFYCYLKVQPFDILSPVVGLIVLLFLYSFASALYVETFGAVYFGDAVSDSSLRIYYICCLVGLVGLTLGAQLGSRVTNTPTQQTYERYLARLRWPDAIFTKRLMFWSIALGIPFGAFVLPQFNFFHVASYAERAFASRVEHSEVASSGLKEVFFSKLPATFILCAATLLMLRAHRRLIRISALCIFLAYVIANTLAGWRGSVVAALLIPLVYYHYRVKRLSLRFAAVGGLSIYLFVNALSVVRVTSDPFEMISVLRSNIAANGLAFASLSSSGELMVGGNLTRLISGIQSGETNFTYGRSLLNDLLVFVPRSLYANRPLPLSEQFAEVFYPGLLESGGGRGLFILQDGYWSFGIPGVFLSMVLYGWLVQKIYLVFMKRLNNDLAVLWYSAVYGAIVLAAVRTGMISSLKSAFLNSLPFLILWLLVKLGRPTLVPGALE